MSLRQRLKDRMKINSEINDGLFALDNKVKKIIEKYDKLCPIADFNMVTVSPKLDSNEFTIEVGWLGDGSDEVSEQRLAFQKEFMEVASEHVDAFPIRSTLSVKKDRNFFIVRAYLSVDEPNNNPFKDLQEEFGNEYNSFTDIPEEYWDIPKSWVRSLMMYVVKGCRPGGFLESALRDEFVRAVTGCDPKHAHAFPALAKFIYNRMPSFCWGSQEKIDKWIKNL